MATKIIMSWSKCKVEVAETPTDESFPTALNDVGTIKDKSTNLSSEDGETLTATATGGVVVAQEEGEPTVSVTTRVMEMDFDKEKLFTGATPSDDGSELVVKTNVVSKDFAVKITPKNIGAIGIKIRRAHVSFRPGSSEEEGNYVDLTFKVLACSDGELYKKFRVADADWSTSTTTATT